MVYSERNERSCWLTGFGLQHAQPLGRIDYIYSHHPASEFSDRSTMSQLQRRPPRKGLQAVNSLIGVVSTRAWWHRSAARHPRSADPAYPVANKRQSSIAFAEQFLSLIATMTEANGNPSHRITPHHMPCPATPPRRVASSRRDKRLTLTSSYAGVREALQRFMPYFISGVALDAES